MADIEHPAPRQPGPLRAVVASDFWFGATARDLAAGLRECGWDVAEVDIFHYVLVSHLKIIKIFSRILGAFITSSYTHAILKAVSDIDADLMLTVKGSYINRKTLRALADNGVFRANFYPDVCFDHPGLGEKLFQDYDLVATTKSFHIAHLTEMIGNDRVVHIPHGYSALIHREEPFLDEEQFWWDIGFVGNASAYKLDWLLAVADAFPDRRIHIVGGGWSSLAKGTKLEPFVLGHPLTGDLYARTIQRCRINLAIHSDQPRTDRWYDLTSTRTFEIPAYRGFMLHVDNSEVRGLFNVGTEIDVFATKEQLIERIAHYLDQPEQRRSMAERAYARCVPNYSVASRAAELDRLIRPRLAKARSIKSNGRKKSNSVD